MHRNLFPKSLLCLLVFASTQVRADDSQTLLSETPILLPEVSINETVIQLPKEKWYVGHIDNFDVFSNTSVSETRTFITQLYKFHQAFTFVFPKAKTLAKTKITLVLCNSQEKFNELSPKHEDTLQQAMGSFSLGDNFTTYQVINLDLYSVFTAGAARDEKGGAIDGGIDNEDAINRAGANGEGAFDNEGLIRREYLRLLFSKSEKPLPPWQTEGATQYFGSMAVTKKGIVYGRLNPATHSYFSSHGIPSLKELFSITPNSPEYKNAVGSDFSQLALLFFHYGMFGDKTRYRKAFLEFLDRSSKESVTEDIFKSYFNMGFAKMEYELRLYLDSGAFRHPITPTKTDLLPVPEIELREASESERGQTKGDLLRLLKQYENARRELIVPVMHKQADSRLLATLGQLDYETNNPVSARKFLEASVAAKVDSPAAYIFLARLRLDQYLHASAEPQLSTPQLNQVLTPLFAALTQKLSHVELYTTIADAWLYSKTAPTLEDLAILNQGVLAFPRNTDLIYKNAVLKTRHGYTDDARSLIELGLKVSRASDNRNRFEQLKATLPATAAK